MTIPHTTFSRLRRAPPGRWLATALLLVSTGSYAAHPLITDDTGTQGSTHWQFELNTDHTRVREAGQSAWEREVNAALTYGLTDDLDIAVNVPWLHLSAPGASRERGIGDATLLAKWRFYDDGKGWTLGVRPELTVPSGRESRGLGNGRATAGATLLSSLERGDWTWLANAGYTWNDNRAGDRRNLWAVSTAALYALTPKWTLAADVGIARSADPAERHEKYGLLGVIYSVSDDLDLDIGWRRSLGSGPTAHTLGAGVTLRW